MVSYAYDMRGWTREISTTEGFSERMFYQDGNLRASYYNGNISKKVWTNSSNPDQTRSYWFLYDKANRMTHGMYYEGGSQTSNKYNERFTYDANGNITKMYHYGKMQNGKYGYVDKLTTMGYSGNQLTGAKDTSNPVTAEGSTDFKGEKNKLNLMKYNGVGSLVRDDSRGIALIEYDDMNNPKRIQFTNGNVTKYVYSATGEKLRTIYQTAVPNITVAVGTAHELTAQELLYADSTDYYHGGKLTVKNGKIDKYYFDGGYAQATMDEATQSDDFAFFYYTADHLGNIREVVNEDGAVEQITNYYPFGTPYSAEDCATHNPDQQTHKYNGKEFDTTHGLNTYDYGARQYNSLVGRWDRIDPLCEKYYSVSPYAYCLNNPVNAFDPDGALTLFINGWNSGLEGGLSTYWGGFDKKIKTHFNDYKCRYYDGSLGGAFMTLVSINQAVREGFGYIDGQMSVSNIIKNLARNKNGEIIEKIRIISHSMGGAYAKGFVRAIVEYVMKHPKLCEGLSIDEYDFAPYQSKYLTAINGVETFQYSHLNDGVAGNNKEKGSVHYMTTSNAEDDGHSIQDFTQYINSLPEGHYVYRNGKFVKTDEDDI